MGKAYYVTGPSLSMCILARCVLVIGLFVINLSFGGWSLGPWSMVLGSLGFRNSHIWSLNVIWWLVLGSLVHGPWVLGFS